MKNTKCSQNINGKLTFRATEAEVKEIKKRAAEKNMGLSSYLRQQALAETASVTKEERQEFQRSLLSTAAICAELESILMHSGIDIKYKDELEFYKEKLIKLCQL